MAKTKIIPNTDTLPVKLGTNGKLIDRDGNDIIIMAPAPTIKIPSAVNENAYVQGTVGMESYDAIVEVTADHGDIDILNNTGLFMYKAPDIKDGNDTTDTIKASYKIGNMISREAIETINVKYVDIVADDGIQVVDFSSDSQVNDGFNYYN